MSGTAYLNWPLYTSTSGNWLNKDWPVLSVTASGVAGQTGSASIAFPLFSGSLAGGADVGVCDFPLFGVIGAGEVGANGTLSRPFELFALTASGGKSGAAALDYALFTLVASGGELIDIDGSLPFPLFTAAGAGQAVLDTVATNDYVVWVVNTETKAHSTYVNWQVSSLTEFNGKWFITLPDGIYELAGGADGATAINAAVYWPPSEFGTTKQKRLDAAYVHLRQGGNFKLVAVTDELQKRIYGQDMTGFPAGLHPKRVQFTRGLKGRMWQIGFENTNGADFDLAEIEVVTIPESRRLK